jgi:hypothetical protein
MPDSYRPYTLSYSTSNGVDSQSALNPPKTSTQTLSQTKVLDMFVLLHRVVHSDRYYFTPPSSTVHTPLTHSTTLTNNHTDWINKVWPTEYTKWLTALHPHAHNFSSLVHVDSSQSHTPRLITSHHPLEPFSEILLSSKILPLHCSLCLCLCNKHSRCFAASMPAALARWCPIRM